MKVHAELAEHCSAAWAARIDAQGCNHGLGHCGRSEAPAEPDGAGSAGARLALPAVAQSAIIASAQYNSRANMQHLEGFLVLAGRRGQAAARRGRACSPCPRRPTPASTIDRGRQPLSQCTAARFGSWALANGFRIVSTTGPARGMVRGLFSPLSAPRSRPASLPQRHGVQPPRDR